MKMRTLQEIAQLSIAKKIDTKSVCHDNLEQIRIPKILKRGIICEFIKRLLFKCKLCGYGDGYNITHFYLHRYGCNPDWNNAKRYCSLCYKSKKNKRINYGSPTYITLRPLDEIVTAKNFSKFIACQWCARNYVRLIDGFRWKCFNCSNINTWSDLKRDTDAFHQYMRNPDSTYPLYHITINNLSKYGDYKQFEINDPQEHLYCLFHVFAKEREDVVYVINGVEFHDVADELLTIEDVLPYGIKNSSELILYEEDTDIIDLIFNIDIKE